MPGAHTRALGSLLPASRSDLAAQSLVFILYFVVAKLSLLFYFGFETSPALIWPPVGIAAVAVLYGGYRMCIPIFLAHFLATATQIVGSYGISLVNSFGFAIQAAATLYVFRSMGFDTSLEKLRNVLVLVFVGVVVTMVQPLIATLYQLAVGGLITSAPFYFGRLWGGGVFAMLVVVPFIVQWYPWRSEGLSRRNIVEIIAALVLLTINNYFVFWTLYPQFFGIAVIFFLPAVLIWFALRFHPRWLALAVFWTAVFGIAGTVLGVQRTGTTLASQLIAVEVYIGLIAAIFYVFAAVVEERRAAYRRLEQAYESTYAADQAKNEFIAILAHELRNPLAPIVSSLELLKLEPQTEESIRTIESAQEHTTMIRRLLDDLLDTARLSQRKFKLQKETVRVGEVIEQSVASIQNDIRARNHTLSVAVTDPDLKLFADPVRIKQIVINLLSNAAKYTEPGGRIELSCLRAGDSAIIRVKDSGIGIDPAHIASLFEPFKQLPTERMSAGLGIGLFITKRLVEMHEGTIQVESTGKNEGSTFTIRIPLPAQLPLPSLEKQRAMPEKPAGAKILIVDDNEAAAIALKKLLTHLGHTVEAEFSGSRAIQSVEKFAPEFVLLDIGMPDIDGYEVARRIRATNWRGTIIALTGYGQETDKNRSKEAGFDHHLVKPVSTSDISALLAAAR